MNRFFNTAGPCVPGKHYLLDASERLLEVVELIRREQYFVIHAARQSGKTTLLLDLRKTLEAEGKHRALYCSLESLQGVTDPKDGLPAIVRCLIGVLPALLAIERLREQARGGGLARAARTHEQVGVRHAVRLDRARERLDHVVLADHLLELLRAPFARQNFV